MLCAFGDRPGEPQIGERGGECSALPFGLPCSFGLPLGVEIGVGCGVANELVEGLLWSAKGSRPMGTCWR